MEQRGRGVRSGTGAPNTYTRLLKAMDYNTSGKVVSAFTSVTGGPEIIRRESQAVSIRYLQLHLSSKAFRHTGLGVRASGEIIDSYPFFVVGILHFNLS